jgi:hypothetical protein
LGGTELDKENGGYVEIKVDLAKEQAFFGG